jgi:hypothetical protein
MSVQRGDGLGVRGDGVSVMPWQQTFNGYTWEQMPGASEEDKKMNFFLYRRGLLDVEEIEHARQEDLEESQYLERAQEQVMQMHTRKLRVKQTKLWGCGKRRTRHDKETTRQSDKEPKKSERIRRGVECELLRAKLKTRLRPLSQIYAGLMQVTRRAGLWRSALFNLLKHDQGLVVPEQLRKVHAVLDALDRGEWQLSHSVPGGRRGAVAGVPRGGVPQGYESWKSWLEREAKRRGCELHALRVYFYRHPELMPPVLRTSKRGVYVRLPDCVGNDETRMANEERRAAA